MEIFVSFLQLAAYLSALAVIVLCNASLFVGVLYGVSRLLRRVACGHGTIRLAGYMKDEIL